jgi:LysM repeat protein
MRFRGLRSVLGIVLAASFVLSGCARAPRKDTMMSSQPPQAPSAWSPAAGFYHTVERGQTVYRIAKNYNVDWHELLRVNHISNPSALEVGQKLLIPRRPAAETFQPAMPGPLSYEDVRRQVGVKRTRSVWRTITIHHSGTVRGNAKLFHKDHTRRRMGGLFYHFVIGNGSNSGNGQLEVGFRWPKQIKANRPNDIQICLVGDFNKQYVSEAQFSTLVTLVGMLREDYDVPIGSIRVHGDIKGKHTACPGKHFPFERLITELMKR